MPASKNNQSGFSLIELLVAVVILAVGLLGLAQLQVTAIKANSQSATKTAATSLAQQAIEAVMAWDSELALLDTSHSANFDLARDGLGPTVSVPGAGTYTVTYTLETPYQGIDNLCRVDVEVKSVQAVMGVLGNKVRTVEAHTLRQAN